MARETNYSAICAQVNSALDVRGLIDYVDWYPEKLVRQGEIYRALCPVHGEKLFRTLVLNPRNNTYHCEHTKCPAHHPADFLDLLTRVFDQTLPEAIKGAVDHFGAEYFRLTDRQLRVIEELVREAQESKSEEI